MAYPHARSLSWVAAPGLVAVAATWRHRRNAAVLRAAAPLAPPMAGVRHWIHGPDGRIAYRMIERAGDGPPVVLVHGWGRTADSSWWAVYPHLNRTVVAIDLPGHGESSLAGRFGLTQAARAVTHLADTLGLVSPVLVGHSMGGAVSLTAARAYPRLFSRTVVMATSAYWVRPKNRVTVSLAPYVLAPSSPVLIQAVARDIRHSPGRAATLAWEQLVRPERRILVESATALRRFDARRWGGLDLELTWVVTTRDGVIAPAAQRRSASALGATVLEIPHDHSFVATRPDLAAEAIEAGDALGQDTSRP